MTKAERGRTHVVLVAGFAGAGKTEFAKLLAAALHGLLLDKDGLWWARFAGACPAVTYGRPQESGP